MLKVKEIIRNVTQQQTFKTTQSTFTVYGISQGQHAAAEVSTVTNGKEVHVFLHFHTEFTTCSHIGNMPNKDAS